MALFPPTVTFTLGLYTLFGLYPNFNLRKPVRLLVTCMYAGEGVTTPATLAAILIVAGALNWLRF
jgi:hypothetical protein